MVGKTPLSEPRKRSGAGWGNTLDAAPHLGLAGPQARRPRYSPPVNEVSAARLGTAQQY